MSELRKDPASGRWVVIATERGKRPHDFVLPETEKVNDDCPFCPGNESMTPPEIFAAGRKAESPPDSEGWQVRAIPNKFPALSMEAGMPRHFNDEVFPIRAGVGVHEVIVETPDHDATFGQYSNEQLRMIMDAILCRYRALKRNGYLHYVQIFKNVGRTAGASLEHNHWQLIGIPLVPVQLEQELRVAAKHWGDHGRCVYCSMLEEELKACERVVESNDKFAAFCPFASRFPYEVMVLPCNHRAGLELLNEEEAYGLGLMLSRVVRRLERAFDNLPYNIVFHTAPWAGLHEDYYHFHVEIIPRLTVIAGFEFGTGFFINPTAPELAADTLKRVSGAREIEHEPVLSAPGY